MHQKNRVIDFKNYRETKIFIEIEIKNPNAPKIKIPIVETFAMFSNSFRVGFFIICQTRLHFIKKDFVVTVTFFIII